MSRPLLLARVVTNHPLPAYVAAMLAISWSGFLLAGGSGVLTGADWETDPGYLRAVAAMTAGPPLAAIALTWCASGVAGVRELFARVTRWRVGVRWYALALLTAPVVELTVLLGLSRAWPEFVPEIVTEERKALLLVTGLAVGLGAGLMGEIGWTGFATARLAPRHGALVTGLIVGPVWSVWQALELVWIGEISAEAVPLPLYVTLAWLASAATLTAYRVLMVWLFEHTHSLWLSSLMHGSYVVTTVGVLAPHATGAGFLTYSASFAVALWGLVGVIGLATGFSSSDRLEAPAA